jgi:hypothetical protein
MNLIFGKTALALYLVFLLPMVMALVLFVVKRDKPERFLVHWARYHLSCVTRTMSAPRFGVMPAPVPL